MKEMLSYKTQTPAFQQEGDADLCIWNAEQSKDIHKASVTSRSVPQKTNTS